MLQKFLRRRKEKLVKSLYGSKPILRYRRDLWLLLRATNYIDRKLLLNLPYEETQLMRMLDLIESERIDIFIDVGANIGLYSLSVAKHAASVEAVVAFEPQPENFNQLCANIFLNGLDNRIVAHRIGVSDRAKQVNFLRNIGNSTGTSRIRETAPETTRWHRFEEDKIQVDSLDNLLPHLSGKRLAIKIDVEGHEVQVLEGMGQLLRSNECHIQLELLPGSQHSAESLADQFGLRFVHRVDNDCYFHASPNSIGDMPAAAS